MDKQSMTPSQRAAVEDRGGTLLVSAAAGSGKTMVLVNRLMEYITDPNRPRNITDFLIITYTKAAAAELRGKISTELHARLAAQPDSVHLQRQLSLVYLAQISTVHSFCAGILRQYACQAELTPDFRVAEERDCAQLKQTALDNLLEERYARMEPGFTALADTLGAGRDDSTLAKLTLRVYASMQTHPEPEKALALALETLRQSQAAGGGPWTDCLLDGLAKQLTAWRLVLARAADTARQSQELAKAYLPSLEISLDRLESLAAAAGRGWDAVVGHPAVADRKLLFPNLGAVRRCQDLETKMYVTGLRDTCKDAVKSLLEPFNSPATQILADLALTVDAVAELFALTGDFTAAYDREKARRSWLDFSDLEHKAIGLLVGPDGQPTAAAQEVSKQYTQVLVDEYQDTNAVQDAIFQAVSQGGRNLFLVGDVKQSIYRFRLADPTLFLERYRRYAPAEQAAQGQPRKILLSQNFRSRPQVLEAANSVFSAVMSPEVGGLDYGPAEALVPGAVYPAGDVPTELHVIAADAVGSDDAQSPGKQKTEAAFVARRIRQLLDEPFQVSDGEGTRAVEPGDIVILLRSPSSVAGVYLAALQALNIPAAAERGGTLLATPEVQTLLSLLQVVDNPQQDIPLAAVLASPAFGCTAGDLADFRLADKSGSFYDALVAASASSPKAQAFLTRLDALRELAPTAGVGRLVWAALQDTGLYAATAAGDNGEARCANLSAIFRLACQFETGGKGLAAFLIWLQAQAEVLKPAAGTPNAVTLLSIHKSKGLEYPVVFLCDLSRVFNTTDLREQVLFHPQLGVGARAVDLEGGQTWPTVAVRAISQTLYQELKSEELRILYVAMTRAREKLIMTYCERYASKRLGEYALTAQVPVSPVISQSAGCLGAWVLLRAITRPEAGALWEAGGQRPRVLVPGAYPWRIQYHSGAALQALEAPEAAGTLPAPAEPSSTDPEELAAALTFRYPHAAAVAAASKLTATQLKGRLQDQEAAEEAEAVREVQPAQSIAFPRPNFSTAALTPQERGTAVHLAMQYADYAGLTDTDSARKELSRLTQAGFLTAQQAQAVDPGILCRFFASQLGQRVLAAGDLVREFKFSLLTDAGEYYPGAQGEQVLLQGMVDCCLLEPDGLTILDFKTDRIRPGQATQRGEHYRPQLAAYANALSRIFDKPVKQKLLYFFFTGETVELL